jgi:hypothetical protein
MASGPSGIPSFTVAQTSTWKLSETTALADAKGNFRRPNLNRDILIPREGPIFSRPFRRVFNPLFLLLEVRETAQDCDNLVQQVEEGLVRII